MGFLRRRGAWIGLISAICLVFLATAATVAFTSSSEEPADAAVGGLFPETPRRGLPRVLDGTVFDSARVGNVIVVGGDFTQIEKSNGEIVTVSGAYAYHIDSGSLVDTFLPAFVKTDGAPSVLAVEPAGPDSVLLGGKFGSVNSHAHRRLTKITISTGQVDTSFASDFNGPVRDVVLKNNRLFVGGEFTEVNGVPRGRLVEMNGTTGAVDTSFRHDITGSTHFAGTPFGPKHLAITPNNTLVVVHRARFVGTEERRGIALINLANDTVLPWSTNFWEESAIHIVDAEVAPDGSYLVVAGDGGDFPFWGRDSATAFNLTDPNAANQAPRWIARNFDSTYAVGISDDAVYIGGHFCWVESELAPDPYPGDGEFTNNNSCFGITPASRFAPAVVNRDQIAALDPETGHALLWDPGSDGIEGVQSIEVIGRGLLVGHDGTFLGRDGADRRAWNVGRHGFFDITQPDGKNNSLFIDQPVVGLCNGLEPTLTGTMLDDVLVGTDGDDVILAGPGRDTIDGGAGNDTICGGRDNDMIRGGNGNDVLFGNEAADTLIGGFGNDDLRGGYWKDTLLGGAGNDILRGGRGSDVLEGGTGTDTLYGNDGMDYLNGGAGNDLVDGQQGRDQVQGSSGADTVRGGIGRDRCSGALFGNANNPGDTLAGCERS